MRVTFLLLWLAPGWAQEVLYRADSLAVRGFHKQADSLYRRFFTASPSSLPFAQIGESVRLWGESSIALRDFGCAESLAALLVRQPAPWQLAGHNLYGQIAYIKGQPDSAQAHWEAAYSLPAFSTHPYALTAKANLATLLIDYPDKWPIADSLLQEVVQKRSQLLGLHHPDYAEGVNQLAVLAFSSRRLGQADSLLRYLLSWYAEHHTPFSPGYVRCLISLSNIYVEKQAWPQAESLLSRSWQMDSSTQLLGLNERAHLLRSLGMTHANQDHPSLAEYYLRASLQLIASPPTSLPTPEELITRNDLAVLYATYRRVEEAAFLYTQIQDGWEKLGLTQHREYINALNNQAVLQDEQGNTSEAERLYLRARLQLPSTTPLYLYLTLNLAIFYADHGRTTESEALLTEFGQRWEAGGFPRTSAWYLNYLNSLAISARTKGDLRQADSLRQYLLTVVRQPDFPLTPNALTWVYNYAPLLLEIGQPDTADSLLRWALTQATLRKFTREKLIIQMLLGRNLQQQSRYTEARSLWESTLAEYKVLLPTHQNRFMLTVSLALLYEQLGEREAAFALALEGFDTLYAFLERAAFGLSERTRLGRSQQLHELATLLLSLSLQAQKSDWIDLAMERYLRQYGFLLRTAERYRNLALRHPNPEIARLYRRWRDLQRQLAQHVDLTELNSTPERLRLQADSIEAALGAALGVSFQPTASPTRPTLQASLTRRKAWLFFLLLPDSLQAGQISAYRYWAVWLGHQGTWQFVPLMPERAARSAYLSYTERLYAQAPDADSYYRFWAPVQAALPPHLHTLYIVPTGLYTLIAIEGLSPDGYTYVGNRYQIYRRLRLTPEPLPSSPRKKPNALLIGNPKYSSTESGPTRSLPPGYRNAPLSGIPIPQLPGTATEVHTIARGLQTKGFSPVEVWTDTQATEKAVKALSSPPAYLHFATHGLFLERKSQLPLLNSGLLLAGCSGVLGPDEKEDGILTALEVLGLPLVGCEAVVLSACETGLAHLVQGEAVYGLSRAFLEAGAKRVLVALWRVDDAATLALMQAATEKGLPTPHALRKAQRKLRRSPEWRHPYYWAGFVWQE